MCGECCRAGFEVNLYKEDIEKWKMLEKNELLVNIMIKPRCIATKKRQKYKSYKEGFAEEFKRKNRNIDVSKEKLIEFILKNHLYFGKSCIRQHIKTILPNTDDDPVYAPKNFNIILKGLELGLIYVLRTDVYGTCPFLNLNLCTINEIKPVVCKKFPYTKDNSLRNDKPYLNICEGLRKMK